MKKELKPVDDPRHGSAVHGISPYPDEEGTERHAVDDIVRPVQVASEMEDCRRRRLDRRRRGGWTSPPGGGG